LKASFFERRDRWGAALGEESQRKNEEGRETQRGQTTKNDDLSHEALSQHAGTH
jgi:hypothetical protein